MKTNIIFILILVSISLSASIFDKAPPKCSDKVSTDTVKRIYENFRNKQIKTIKLSKSIESFKNIRATSYNKEIALRGCKATIILSNKKETSINYTVQLDETNDNKFYVDVDNSFFKYLITQNYLERIKKPTYIKNTKPTPKVKKISKKRIKTDPFEWMKKVNNQNTKPTPKVKKISKKNIKLDDYFKESYGNKFNELTIREQNYILSNQKTIVKITKSTFRRVCRVNLPKDLHVKKDVIVEFYLHENGKISNFKFIKKSGYYVIEDTSKETIEYSHSRYPRPSSKTLIRLKLNYNI